MLTDLDFELEPLFPYRISSIFIEWISPTGIYPPKRIGLCIPPPLSTMVLCKILQI